MNIGRLFSEAGRLLRQHKTLWFLGGLAALATEALTITVRLLTGETGGTAVTNPLLSLQILLNAANQTQTAILAVIALMAVLLIVWLLSAIAEGGLITGVIKAQTESQLQFIPQLRRGLSVLWRFIAIDTILFFPLFLVLLLALLLSGGALAALAIAIENGGSIPEASTAVVGASIGAACFACLTLPVGLLTFLYRLLAFRAAAVDDLSTRASIGVVWPLIKQHLGYLLLVGFIILTLRIVGAVAQMIIAAVLPTDGSSWGAEIGLIITGLLLTTLLHTYGSAVWTLFYQQLTPKKQIHEQPL